VSKSQVKPTGSELQILAVLWRQGASTVREVHAQLDKDTGYTTVLKFMQIMTDKGLLRRERRGKSHVYRPAVAQEQTQRHLVGDLVHRAFGGSVRKLLVAALSSRRTSPQELEEIRKLIDQLESQQTATSAKKGDTP
jgi:predicted transcriptional regulator